MQLQLKDVSFVYNEGSIFQKKALENINIIIKESEFIALIGHTGSGKSTLVQLLNGLLKPTIGNILVDGKDIFTNKFDIKTVRQKIGIVFQYPEYQLFETTVFKDVAFGPANMNLSKEEIDRRVCSALKIVGIDEKDYNKSPFDLSGGQKRRAAIAGVLAMEPDILVLDEPTAGLDPRGRDEILQNIKEMHEKLKISIVLVSHSMDDVSRLAQRVIVLADGKVVLEGSVNEVFKKSSYLEEIGLSIPQITQLMNELKKKGFDVPLNVYTVEDATKIISNILKQV